MRTVIVRGLKTKGPDVTLETYLNPFSLNALLEIWYLGAYDNLDSGPGGTIFDLGANVGDFTLKASRWVGENGIVIAVEPVAEHLTMLHRNLARNHVSNVIVVPKAISDRKGLVDIEGKQVEAASIDELVNEFSLREVNSVKLDIEGAELLALQGGKQVFRQASHIAAETHSDDLRGKVWGLLESARYRVRQPSFSALSRKMASRLLTNPKPFLFTEAVRSLSWEATGGPFARNISKWLYRRQKPDWFNQQSGLGLLVADRADTWRVA